MKSIRTHTRKSATDKGEKVSEIHTSNKFLILYLNDQKNHKKSTVIDISFKDKIMWIRKNDNWTIVSEKLSNRRLEREIFKTEEQWGREIAEDV
jgi:TPP-dependent trihydroxycyclohexane-1,2-dione (THcHDO) dehydratase